MGFSFLGPQIDTSGIRDNTLVSDDNVAVMVLALVCIDGLYRWNARIDFNDQDTFEGN